MQVDVHERPASRQQATRHRLREAIVGGELSPGSRLREVDLAKQLDVSRTPLREALRDLEAEGLVRRFAGMGAFVSPLEASDVGDVYRVKGVLQLLEVELATERMDSRQRAELAFLVEQLASAVKDEDHDYYAELLDRFHSLLLTAAGSPTLTRLFGTLDPQIRRYRRFVLAQPGREVDSLDQHRAIAEAILQQDKSAAIEGMRQHSVSAREFVTAQMAKQQSVDGGAGEE